MVFPEEIAEPESCSDCGAKLVIEVQHSNAGYYLGTWCDCGPYARLSYYFPSREAAEAELKIWNEDQVRPSARTPGYWGDQQ